MKNGFVPSNQELRSIPLARAGEYDLTDRECRILRSRVYSLNKNNAAGWRWRTSLVGGVLLVWRIR